MSATVNFDLAEPLPGPVGATIEDGWVNYSQSQKGDFLKVTLQLQVFERPDAPDRVGEVVFLSFPLWGGYIRRFKALLNHFGVHISGKVAEEELQDIVAGLKGRHIYTVLGVRDGFIDPTAIYGNSVAEIAR